MIWSSRTQWSLSNTWNLWDYHLFSDLGVVLGIPIRTALKTQGNLNTAISSANNLVTSKLGLITLLAIFFFVLWVFLFCFFFCKTFLYNIQPNSADIWPFIGVTQIASALTTLNTTLGDVKVKANILSSNLSTLKTDIETQLNNSGCPTTPGCPDLSNLNSGLDTNNVSPQNRCMTYEVNIISVVLGTLSVSLSVNFQVQI